MTTSADPTSGPGATPDTDQARTSLATAAARNLATTTKTVPQMQGISSRWLLRVLPWTQVSGGTYRVNRRLTHTLGDGRVEFTSTGSDVRVIPAELRELPPLRDFDDPAALEALAGQFVQEEHAPGDVLVEQGRPADRVVLVAHGKLNRIGTGKYGDETVLGVLADGDHLGETALLSPDAVWEHTVRAVTRVTVLTLPRTAYEQLADRSPGLRDHLERYRTAQIPPQNKHGEAAIDVASGHTGEPALPGTFVNYEVAPREYELSVAQTVLKIHTRVADLYNNPMNQLDQQLRLTIEALRERQEHEMVNNREFGLLHNADLKQRIHTRSGPPTPDDLDELIARRRKTQYLLAHPRTIAAIGREWNARGIYPTTAEIGGTPVRAWRGIPLLPCNKIPVNPDQTSSIIAMRVGEENQGVVGLHQTGIPDEYQPGLSVRFMGINDQAVINYLVSAYYSAAVLVPDALGVLEDVEIGH
ncbi:MULTISPECIES: family 2B encapsulin nanocompartment shell protein [Streptomyces]|uniref:Cyclic nucleotide-binding domain-containing protein n=3 Tax=Streptomyces rimosus TaxID=1927 RepID=L8EUP8_STRR1|nr:MULTISPECIES: family 2B encapsulin nanocompartment shell protein [Streptomyces]KOG71280.1 Crp/Fnr family transcriptional regulator [Kitasatospora aureofaciens]MYT48614.1 cyclic nucleotide-binding domain-containing protein [Streptomyces sp. SID5471]KEF08880.1 Crp/Fnr family transcriptional regulator [Streptomyces rimosus]KOT39215.1 Crp/Fnr family transcriptional regulator [Streptomyces sp. NRRL WC-3701]KOT40202.1 Crp/Fnr family transcriptional regulator [Streptomyces rimosus subsp. rimosus]